jgi:hypothetical protein
VNERICRRIQDTFHGAFTWCGFDRRLPDYGRCLGLFRVLLAASSDDALRVVRNDAGQVTGYAVALPVMLAKDGNPIWLLQRQARR